MARTKFYKWNGFITMSLEEVLDLLAARGIEMDSDRTALTGSLYNPETQEVSVFLTSMLTTKQNKKFEKDWPF